MAGQSQCALGAYTYAYNPPENVNPVLLSIQHTPTMGGGYDTIWYDTNNSNVPYFQQDRLITQKWPTMDTAMFNSLSNIVKGGAVVTFTDWDGTAYHVLPLSLIPETIHRGGEAYGNVTLTLRVTSQP